MQNQNQNQDQNQTQNQGNDEGWRELNKNGQSEHHNSYTQFGSINNFLCALIGVFLIDLCIGFQRINRVLVLL
jgi:hypothetical protein